MVQRREAGLTVRERLASFEHRVRELVLAVPVSAPVQQLGLLRREERVQKGVVERFADAPHRCENFCLA